MNTYEITLRGFNGATDDTDRLVAWVGADMDMDALVGHLTEKGLAVSGAEILSVGSVPIETVVLNHDFVLPEQFPEFHAWVQTVAVCDKEEVSVIEQLLTAADHHGEDAGDMDHTVGDLQDLLRLAWKIMSVSQRLALLRSDEVENLIECGGRDAFSQSELIHKISANIKEMNSAIVKAGYEIKTVESGMYFWETDEEAGQDCPSREDAVVDAYRALNVSAFQKICEALLKKHYGITLNDTHLHNEHIVEQCIEQGYRPFEIVAEHAEESDLDRIDKSDYGVPSKVAITQADEDQIIQALSGSGEHIEINQKWGEK